MESAASSDVSFLRCGLAEPQVKELMEDDLRDPKLGAGGVREKESLAGDHGDPRWIYALRRREANVGRLPYRFDPDPPSKAQVFKRLLGELLGLRRCD